MPTTYTVNCPNCGCGSGSSGSSSSGGGHPGCYSIPVQHRQAGVDTGTAGCCTSLDAYFETLDFLPNTQTIADPFYAAAYAALNTWDGRLNFGEYFADGSYFGRNIYFTHGGVDYIIPINFNWVNGEVGTSVYPIIAGVIDVGSGVPLTSISRFTVDRNCCRVVFSHDYYSGSDGDAPPRARQMTYTLKNNRCCKCTSGGCAELPGTQTQNCPAPASGSGSSSGSSGDGDGLCPGDLIDTICPCECPPGLPTSVMLTGPGVSEALEYVEGFCQFASNDHYLSWNGSAWELYDAENNLLGTRGTGCIQPEGTYGSYTVA